MRLGVRRCLTQDFDIQPCRLLHTAFPSGADSDRKPLVRVGDGRVEWFLFGGLAGWAGCHLRIVVFP